MKEQNETYHLKKVENSYKAIMEAITLQRRIKYMGDDKESALDIFQRMLYIAGVTKINDWIKVYSEKVEDFNELWFNLTKSLRQVDFFDDLELYIRVSKDCNFEEDFEGMDVQKEGTYKKSGDINVRLFASGHIDMILRSAMQCTPAAYEICREALAEKVKIVIKTPINP